MTGNTTVLLRTQFFQDVVENTIVKEMRSSLKGSWTEGLRYKVSLMLCNYVNYSTRVYQKQPPTNLSLRSHYFE